MSAIVDQHSASRDGRVGIPAARHVDPRRKSVLEQHDFAEHARRQQALGANHVVHIAELGRHREDHARGGRGSDHLGGVARFDRKRLLAQDAYPAREEAVADVGVRARRRAHNCRLDVRLRGKLLMGIVDRAADAFGKCFGGLGPHVGDGGDAGDIAAAQRLHVRLRDGPGADQAEAQRPSRHDRVPCTAARISRARSSTIFSV